ncbi:UPF0481 protein At3g47200-like [Lolium rigidum]|uniref:UPF0481 protein At3g47200-like n=1 Tax=Lolium rigidum TaxID=89674 RepID=UPI001F5CD9E0|nr:UPF0481 protein At3g47200-like [Lolium rigidum]
MQIPCDYQLAVSDWEGTSAMEPTAWVPGFPFEMTVAAPASNTLVVSSSGLQQLNMVEESTGHQYEWSSPIEVFEQATQAFEDEHGEMETKIHLFPASMKDLSAEYAAPKIVSIGPYHHGKSPDFREMESAKYAAACHFIKDSGHSVEEVWGAVLEVADEARSHYDEEKVRRFGDDDFRPMMFYDGCFLLQYMMSWCGHKGDDDDVMVVDVDPLLNSVFSSNDRRIFSDLVLLENQLPWVVVKKLMGFMPKPLDMETFLGRVKPSLRSRRDIEFDPVILDSSYKPPHLLGLLRHYFVGRNHISSTQVSETQTEISHKAKKVSLSVSIIELAEIGIKLTATKNKIELQDMGVRRGIFTGELFLAPLLLDDANAGFLVNMAALELCMTPDFFETYNTMSVVCSYLCLLGMVTDSEKDVQRLRKKHILQGGGGLTDRNALDLFTSLEKHLRLGKSYDNSIVGIENYKVDRWLWIIVYKFVYNNLKIIIAVVSAMAGFAGFLGAIKSLKGSR